MSDVLTLIAARNEAGSIAPLVSEMLVLGDVLVVVNPSHDATAPIAMEAGATEVIANETDLNIGGSLLKGYEWALRHGYDRVIQMDAGGSHLSRDAGKLYSRSGLIPQPDLVIGSRLLPGSQFLQSPQRQLITKIGAHLGGIATQHTPADYTSGLRVFNQAALKAAVNLNIQERGHAFNWMIAVRLQQQGFHLEWEPINYVATSSSASLRSLWEAAWAFAVACSY